MFCQARLNGSLLLKGRYFRSFIVGVSEYLSLILFIASVLSSVYLLIFDTSFLEKTGVFSDVYALIAVCAFFVSENTALLFIYIYTKLFAKQYFTFSKSSQLKFSHVCTAFLLYINLLIRKILLFLVFSLPSAALLFLIKNLTDNGITVFLLNILSAGFFVLTAVSLFCYGIYIQKYYMCDIILYENKHFSIRQIIRQSEKMMNGKCFKLFLLKVLNLPKRLISFFILPSLYYLPVIKAVEADFAVSKENPYMQNKAHTEKTVIFYFKPIKEN